MGRADGRAGEARMNDADFAVAIDEDGRRIGAEAIEHGHGLGHSGFFGNAREKDRGFDPVAGTAEERR